MIPARNEGGYIMTTWSSRTLRHLSIIVLLILASFCQAAGVTARTGLAQANKAAAAWKADAKLTNVSTTVLKTDGTALVWTYSYLSPGSKSCARLIMINGGEPRLQDLGKCNPAKPISDKFVDSPEMLKAAVDAGFKPGEDSNAYLEVKHDQLAQDKSCWVVFTSKDFANGYMRGWCVDPKTGKFVVRLSGKMAVKKQ